MEVKEKVPIQVFEHDYLRLGEQGFEPAHFDALVRLNERHGNQYFTVGHKKIKFGCFVGVLQVSGLTIEVLPKADRSATGHEAKRKWRDALLTMLTVSKGIDLHAVSHANLAIRKSSILDLYVDFFLKQVETMVHRGLVKKYRKEQSNSNTLKGKLILSEHVRRNFIHKEKFFTERQVYNTNTLLNQVLKRALRILGRVSQSRSFDSRIRNLLLSFEEISDITIKERHFDLLPKLNRKTQHYKQALQFARLIILQYNPDLTAGKENAIALLFNMNELFESYVYKILKRTLREQRYRDYSLTGQSKRLFWGRQTIRPDIILTKHTGEKIVVDTKWKLLYDYRPSDADLKQMYAYNIHFGAKKSVLLYPKVFADKPVQSMFHKSVLLNDDHSCGLYFAEIFDEFGKAKEGAGRNILEDILYEDNISN
jgi:5-methylcytosine-specific restriction enzyme subunit McrC